MADTAVPKSEHAHLWFLLDRSGSMEEVRGAVVEGLADFLREQHTADPEARFTLVQFDDVDPHDVVIDARPLADVAPMTSEGFQPRGSTPLYDAIGALIKRVDAHVADGGHDADQVVVVMTDGMENSSIRCTQRSIFKRVAKRHERGWTFVFLGANQDSYATGGAMGVSHSNATNWSATPDGTVRAMHQLSAATQSRLRGTRTTRMATRDQFFESDPPDRDAPDEPTDSD